MTAQAHKQVAGSSHIESTRSTHINSVPKIWRSNVDVTIPSADILTFAFANLDQYDQDKPIFIDAYDPSNFLSARSAKAVVRKLIKGLKEHGLKDGDCVCLHAFNNIWYPLVWLAVIGSGGIVSGSHPAYKSTELIHHFEITDAKYVITLSKTLHTVLEATSRCGIPQSHVFLFDDPDDGVSSTIQSWRTLLQHGEADWITYTKNSHVGENIAAYGSTSGTTGKPKVAMLPHKYYTAQCVMVEARFKDRTYQPIQLLALPVFHAFAAQVGLFLPLRLGIPTYVMPKFVFNDFTRIVRQHSITDTAIVPRILTELLNLPADDTCLKSLRCVLCAGAPITAKLQSQLYQYLSPDATISQTWGATEIGWATAFSWSEVDRTGSVGTLQPGVELKLIDAQGHQVNEDRVLGEAYVRTPSTMRGYHKNPKASNNAIDQDDFYCTGDLCFMVDGKLHVDGRVKDTMKVNGWQVAPAEIEALLLEHPLIKDAVVQGYDTIDDKKLPVTLPQAYIVLKPGVVPVGEAGVDTPPHSPGLPGIATLSARQVVKFVAARLASYKHLRGGVRFISSLPVNSLGKVVRSELKPFDPAEKHGV